MAGGCAEQYDGDRILQETPLLCCSCCILIRHKKSIPRLLVLQYYNSVTTEATCTDPYFIVRCYLPAYVF